MADRQINLAVIIDPSQAVMALSQVRRESQDAASGIQGDFVNLNSIDAFTAKVAFLQSRLSTLDIGSDEFNAVAKDLASAQDQLSIAHDRAAKVAAQSTNQLGQSSGNARISVMSFSQTLSDSTMFQYGFRSGIMSIGNNLEMLSIGLVNTAREAKNMGVPMKDLLLSVLKGPTGLLVGLSALIALVQILPALFGNAKDAASELANEGLRQINNQISKMSLGDQQATFAAAKELLERNKEEIKRLRRDGELEQQHVSASLQAFGAGLGTTQSPRLERISTLQKENELLRQFLDDNKLAVEREERRLKAVELIQSVIVDTREETVKLEARLKEINTIIETGVEKGVNISESRRKELLNERSTLQERIAVLNEATVVTRQARIAEVRESETQEKRKLEVANESRLRELEIAETRALSAEENERRRLDISRGYALQRLQAETSTAKAILDVQEVSLKKQLELSDEQGKITIRKQLETLAIERLAVEKKLTEQTDVIQTTYQSEVRQTELSSTEIAERKTSIEFEQEQARIEREFRESNALETIDLDRQIADSKRNLAESTRQLLQTTDQQEASRLESERRRHQDRLNMLEQEKKARQQNVANQIMSYMQMAAANETYGQSLKRAIRDSIMAYVAQSVAIQMAKVLTSVPFPLNLVVIPAVAVTTQALLNAVIPKFETGGRVESPTLGLVGEAGPEFIAPEKTFYDIARAEIVPKVIGIAQSQTVLADNRVVEELKRVRESIDTLELMADIDDSKLAMTVEGGNKKISRSRF